MSSYDEILSQVPVDQLAARFGVEPGEIEQAAQTALPALLGGMHANAGDPAGASSLLGALGDHQGQVGGLDDIDEGDGQRIVGNIFGGNTDQVVSRLGGGSGSSGGLVAKLLPILAPIVMSWLANRIGQGALGGLGGVLGGGSGTTGSASGSGSGPAAPTGAGSDPESGPLFPGGQGAGSGPVQPPTGSTGAGSDPSSGATSGSNPLQDVLGQVLGGATGGGSGSGAGGVLGGILGDLLGGGRR